MAYLIIMALFVAAIGWVNEVAPRLSALLSPPDDAIEHDETDSDSDSDSEDDGGEDPINPAIDHHIRASMVWEPNREPADGENWYRRRRAMIEAYMRAHPNLPKVELIKDIRDPEAPWNARGNVVSESTVWRVQREMKKRDKRNERTDGA